MAIMLGGYNPGQLQSVAINAELTMALHGLKFGDLNTARRLNQQGGTAARQHLILVEDNLELWCTPTTDDVESWNGSSWTEVNEINTC